MEKIFRKHPQKMIRLFEILIPATSWMIITMPVWLSFFYPEGVAYFVIAFDIYWFYKSFVLATNAIRSYLTLSAHLKVDWLSESKKIPGWEKIHHVIVIPQYREKLSLLRKTIKNLILQDFLHSKISVIVASEERDQRAKTKARILKEEFKGKFAHFWVTYHKLSPDEVAGKSSNMAWAGRFACQKLDQLGFNLKNVTVTSCDADVLLHPKYFSYLTFAFLSDPDRHYHFYQGAIMFYSNIWQIPLPGRVLNTIGSILGLSLLSQGLRLINFSTYSLSLATVKEVGFWGVDVIPEDYHLFFKTYFKKGEKVKVIPIFLPVLAQAAQSRGFWRTMINQFEQHKRWAWGVSDVPRVLKNYFLHPQIPFWDRTLRLAILLEQHLVWPTNWFILTLGSTIPPLLNPRFAKTALGYNLSRISSTILTTCAVFLLVIIFLDLKIKPSRPKEFVRWKIPLLYLQWLTLPVVSFFLSALPGLDAHTRLMLGKRLEYRVTEKI